MAGYISNGFCVDYSDGIGSCKVGKRTYRWEFHEYCGPFFIRKNGECLKIQPGENHPVWKYFEKWLKKYKPKRAAAKSWEIIELDL